MVNLLSIWLSEKWPRRPTMWAVNLFHSNLLVWWVLFFYSMRVFMFRLLFLIEVFFFFCTANWNFNFSLQMLFVFLAVARRTRKFPEFSWSYFSFIEIVCNQNNLYMRTETIRIICFLGIPSIHIYVWVVVMAFPPARRPIHGAMQTRSTYT